MKYCILLFSLIIPFSLFAQIKVTGIVKDTLGLPIPGVTILVKGTTIVTASDINGYFEITLPNKGDTLVFTSIGMKYQEVIVYDSISLEVIMLNGFTELTNSYKGIDYYLSYWGGTLNSPFGIRTGVDIYHQILFTPRYKYYLSFNGGYQTDFRQNQQYFFQSYFYFNSPFNPTLTFRKIDFNYNFHFENVNISNSFFLLRTLISPILGYAYSKNKNSSNNYLGLGGRVDDIFWIWRLILQVDFSVIYWRNFWQLKSGVLFKYRKYSLGVGYEKIQNFEEIQVSFGRRF